MAKTNKYIRRRRFLLIILIIILILAAVMIFKSCGENNDIDNSNNNSSSITTQSHEPIDLNSIDESSDDVIEDPNRELITISSGLDEGDLLLVNDSYSVPEKYKTADFPCIYEKGTAYYVRSTEMYIQQQALDSMKVMFEAAKADGIENMLIIDTYRTQEKQQSIYDSRVDALVKDGMEKDDAKAKVEETVAIPGFSEHQVGLAMDIDLHQTDYVNFEDTEFAKWMDQNSWKYGWILRYPADRTEITDISYEPWHFRYVGICHAQFMYENKLCLEEYIDTLQDSGTITIDSSDGKYEVIYAKSDDDGKAEISIPKGCDYTVSGDNTGGYIVTVKIDQ